MKALTLCVNQMRSKGRRACNCLDSFLTLAVHVDAINSWSSPVALALLSLVSLPATPSSMCPMSRVNHSPTALSKYASIFRSVDLPSPSWRTAALPCSQKASSAASDGIPTPIAQEQGVWEALLIPQAVVSASALQALVLLAALAPAAVAPVLLRIFRRMCCCVQFGPAEWLHTLAPVLLESLQGLCCLEVTQICLQQMTLSSALSLFAIPVYLSLPPPKSLLFTVTSFADAADSEKRGAEV